MQLPHALFVIAKPLVYLFADMSEGRMTSVWSVDDVLIGGSLLTADVLYETFDSEPSTDTWTFWPNGRITEYCLFNTRSLS